MMKSTSYYRQMPDHDLLLHGKEALTYTDEFVTALVERYEDTLEALESATYREDGYVDRIEDLEGEIVVLEEQIVALEKEASALAAPLTKLET